VSTRSFMKVRGGKKVRPVMVSQKKGKHSLPGIAFMRGRRSATKEEGRRGEGGEAWEIGEGRIDRIVKIGGGKKKEKARADLSAKKKRRRGSFQARQKGKVGGVGERR